jgi:hypothetical protein
VEDELNFGNDSMMFALEKLANTKAMIRETSKVQEHIYMLFGSRIRKKKDGLKCLRY